MPAAHLDPKGLSAVGQYRFDRLLIYRVGTPFRLSLCLLAEKRQASEMADEPGTLPSYIRPALICKLLDSLKAASLSGREGSGHAATLERFRSKRADAPCLHGHACGGQSLQHENAHTA